MSWHDPIEIATSSVTSMTVKWFAHTRTLIFLIEMSSVKVVGHPGRGSSSIDSRSRLNPVKHS